MVLVAFNLFWAVGIKASVLCWLLARGKATFSFLPLGPLHGVLHIIICFIEDSKEEDPLARCKL